MAETRHLTKTEGGSVEFRAALGIGHPDCYKAIMKVAGTLQRPEEIEFT